MKKIIGVSFILALIFLPLQAEERGYLNESFARLSFLTGATFVQRASEVGFEEGVVNTPLIAGDRLATTDGRAEVYLSRSNYLRLNEYSKVDLLHLPLPGEGGIHFSLWTGSVYLSIGHVSEENEIVVETPDVNIFILQEGLYRLDVREEEETEIFVFNGVVEVAGDNQSILLKDGQRIEAQGGQFITSPSSFVSVAEDSFDRWNEEREQLVRRRLARRYLPAELNDFEYELDCHGRWNYVSPYGYVWIPVGVDPYWRPYYNGRWVWLPLGGWTWIPYESWGWVTFHFGRWHWDVSWGWYWIPTTVWGPAWVSWYWGYDYVGWAPLSYYNRPVVIINNVFYDRYNYYDYPVRSRALTIVRKNQLQARNISRVTVSASSLGKISKIRLTNQAPNVKPVTRNVSLQRLQGKQVILKKSSVSSYKTTSPRTRIQSSRLTKSTSPSQGLRTIRKSGQVTTRISKSAVTSKKSVSTTSSSTLSRGSLGQIRKSSTRQTIPPSTTKTNRIRRYSPSSSSRLSGGTSSSTLGTIRSLTKEKTPSSSISSSSRYRYPSSSSSFSYQLKSSSKRSSTSVLGKIYNSIIKRSSSAISRHSTSSKTIKSPSSSSSRLKFSSSRSSSRISSKTRTPRSSSKTKVKKKK